MTTGINAGNQLQDQLRIQTGSLGDLSNQSVESFLAEELSD